MPATKMDDLIKNVCEKKHLNTELMKSFSDFIFLNTKQEMFKFRTLRIYLKGFITFFYGKTRLEKFNTQIDKKLTDREEGKKPTYAYIDSLSTEDMLSLKGKVNHLLDVYQIFLEDKWTTKNAYKEYKRKLKEENS